jgi:tetraacyldisaccharide 4'-kinase
MQFFVYLQQIRKRVEQIITGDDRFPFFSLATLLASLSILYGLGVRIRAELYNKQILPVKKLPRTVISIGNLTVGGTGKTPMALYLAKMFQGQGRKILIVSRGYKSRGEKDGAVVSDGISVMQDVHQTGDEPLLLATLLGNIPVIVGKNRFTAGLGAIWRFQPDLIILDDAFQHLRLKRDLNLLLVDSQSGFGNRHLLPRGPLREPISSYRRADAIVVTRCTDAPGDSTFFKELVRMAHPRPVFRAAHVPVRRCCILSGDPVDARALGGPMHNLQSGLQGRKVFAFAGLARNRYVWDTLSEMGADLTGTLGFADHHPYSIEDIGRIVAAAIENRSDCLVTTEKDLVRLPQGVRLPLDLIIIGINLDLKTDHDRFLRFIDLWFSKSQQAGAVN